MECFEAGGRFVNLISSITLALFSRSGTVSSKRREDSRRKRAWEQWWQHRPGGTLNAVLERELGAQEEWTDTATDEGSQRQKRVAAGGIRSSRQYGPSEELYSDPGRMLFGKSDSLTETACRRGLLEDIRFSLNLWLFNSFSLFRKITRKLFMLEIDSHEQARARRKAKRRLRTWKRLHTYTASDAILRAGYPLEEHSVTTDDGYVLQMHRIPRKQSAETVFFQHGVLDTSLGWVAIGTGGSAAFAAYDDGFDVWLGNTRANPPRVNVRSSKRGSKYWRWSANDLAFLDLKAQLEYIHQLKLKELLKASLSHAPTQRIERNEEFPHSRSEINLSSHSTGANMKKNDILPYRLQAVGHSLGAACLLMYAVHSRMQGRQHHIQRLILLSPAGFHTKIPFAIKPCKFLIPIITWGVDMMRPKSGMGLRLPSWPLRWITFKLMADVNRSPILFDLFSAAISALTSGDSSQWTKAMTIPHYSPKSMPAVSLHTANQFAQWARNPVFAMYDYGTTKNMKVYGTESPPSIAKNYHLLADLPVNLALGSLDGLIPPDNVREHMYWLEKGGVRYTAREFEYGHLDFTFGVGDEVVSFIMSSLQETCAPKTLLLQANNS